MKVEKLRDITGLVQYVQKFKFFFGLKLSIDLYKIFDFHVKFLQGDDVNSHVIITMMKSFVKELTDQRNGFDKYWKNAVEER